MNLDPREGEPIRTEDLGRLARARCRAARWAARTGWSGWALFALSAGLAFLALSTGWPWLALVAFLTLLTGIWVNAIHTIHSWGSGGTRRTRHSLRTLWPWFTHGSRLALTGRSVRPVLPRHAWQARRTLRPRRADWTRWSLWPDGAPRRADQWGWQDERADHGRSEGHDGDEHRERVPDPVTHLGAPAPGTRSDRPGSQPPRRPAR